MNWNTLSDLSQLEAIRKESEQQLVLIFKHSTICSISATAKNRLERQWTAPEEKIKIYYLDLLANRNISNQIAEQFGVRHESPQILLIRNGACVYNSSHLSINASTIQGHLS